MATRCCIGNAYGSSTVPMKQHKLPNGSGTLSIPMHIKRTTHDQHHYAPPSDMCRAFPRMMISRSPVPLTCSAMTYNLSRRTKQQIILHIVPAMCLACRP